MAITSVAQSIAARLRNFGAYTKPITNREAWQYVSDNTGVPASGALTRPADMISAQGPQPSVTTGVFIFETEGGLEQIRPILLGADNCQATLYIRAWRQAFDSKGQIPATFPPNACEWTSDLFWVGTIQACTATPIDAGILNSSSGSQWRYCDTLTATTDRLPSPNTKFVQAASADNEPAFFEFDARGYQKIGLYFTVNGLGSAATGCTAQRANINAG